LIEGELIGGTFKVFAEVGQFKEPKFYEPNILQKYGVTFTHNPSRGGTFAGPAGVMKYEFKGVKKNNLKEVLKRFAQIVGDDPNATSLDLTVSRSAGKLFGGKEGGFTYFAGKFKRPGEGFFEDNFKDVRYNNINKVDAFLAGKNESLSEDFERVDIETDKEKMSMVSDEKGKVTVTTEPKEENIEGETIEPVSDEMKAEIESEEETEDTASKEKIKSEESIDQIDVTDVDEEAIDELGESYLKRVYDNVDSYKTTSVRLSEGKLKVEGLIKFTSGKNAKTAFLFESAYKTKKGKLKLIGNNAQISESKNSFTLTGTIENKKLLSESLTYNYKVKGTKDRVYGTIKNI
jgi:hypothetical protein